MKIPVLNPEEDDTFQENVEAVSLLRESIETLSRNITAGVYDFGDLDAHLPWEIFVGDIQIFSFTNKPPFHFVSSRAAESMGYANQQALIEAGGLNILRRHIKKLEAVYWLKHLLNLPRQTDFSCIDYIAHLKVLKEGGKLGFVYRRFLACNLKGYRGKSDIICISFDADRLNREAFAFRTAVSSDSRVREKTLAMHRLCAGKQRLKVFLLRARKMGADAIAARLGISANVVNEHLTEIYRILEFREDKLDQLVRFADAAGFKDTAFYRNLLLVR